MKNTIKTANKIILVGLLAMALAFSIIGCDDPAGDEECTVTFNLDGGNISGDTSSVQIQVKKGTTIDNLLNPQKENNTFGGWFTGPNGSGNEFKTTTVVTSNMTVFAKWKYSGNDGRTVTFDMDGGNIDGNTASITVTVKSGGTIANLPTPQKANNTFGGWFTVKNGSGNAFTASTQVTSNITVYAKWTPSGNSGNDPFAGTWETTSPVAAITWATVYLKYVAANGSFSIYMSDENKLNYAEVQRGTYIYNGNIITMTLNEINYLLLGGVNTWVSFDDLDEASKTNFGGKTSQFTVTGNTITSNGMTITKQ
jgi:uncharacterized repeat protein (TIGR02543 family)